MTNISRTQKYILAITITLGLILRWLYLDARPLHHDESLHYMYSYYPIANPAGGYYKYDPMLHGPLLYTLESYIFRLLGASIFTSRLLPALIGSFFLFIPLIFRKYFSSWTLILSTAFVALSPSLIYWARFNIHDPYFILGITVCFLSLLSKDKKASLISTGLILQFCSKENSYVSIAIILGYLFFEHIFLLFFKDENYSSLLARAVAYCKNYKQDFILSIVLFTFVFCYLFTSSFRNLGPIDKGTFEFYFGSIIDAIYRKSVGYWLNQNTIERIKGPFLFHFYLYLLYEPAFIFLYIASIFLFLKNANEKILKTFLFIFLIYLTSAIYFLRTNIEQTVIGEFFKLKDHLDLFALFFFSAHSFLLTVDHLLKKQYQIAFFAYLFTSTLFTYSYLGEKVPWLSQYPIALSLPYFAFVIQSILKKETKIKSSKFLFYLGIFFITIGIVSTLSAEHSDGFEKVSFFLGILSIIFSLYSYSKKTDSLVPMIAPSIAIILSLNSSVLTNFTHAGKANELMSQVHTTHEFDKTIKRIKLEVESNKIGDNFSVYTTGDPVWPMTAYLNKVKGFKYHASKDELKNACYIFDSFDKKNVEKPRNFKEKKITIRGWWVPDYKTITLKKYINYLLTHKNWNPSGYSYVRMYTSLDKNCGQ